MQCALHVQNVSTFTCSRCGTFGCPACESTVEPGLCEACEIRRSSGVGQGVDAGALIAGSFKTVAAHLPIVLAFSSINGVVDGVVEVLSTNPTLKLILAIPNLVLTMVFSAAWIVVIASAVRGEELPFAEALRRGLGRSGHLFLAWLVSGFVIALGAMLCIVPGVILMLGWALAGPAVVLGGSDAMSALGDSWRMTDGIKGHLLLAYVATGLICGLVGGGLIFGVIFLAQSVHVPDLLAGALVASITSLIAAPLVALPVLAWLRISGWSYSVA